MNFRSCRSTPSTDESILIRHPFRSRWRVLAVLVAIVSLLGHRTHTEEVILQNKVTDQWSYYQAKKIRMHTDELFADLAGVVTTRDAEAAAKVQEKAHAEADRYKEDRKSWRRRRHELEQEFALIQRKADRFDLGEVFLEVALVITSITSAFGGGGYSGIWA